MNPLSISMIGKLIKSLFQAKSEQDQRYYQSEQEDKQRVDNAHKKTIEAIKESSEAQVASAKESSEAQVASAKESSEAQVASAKESSKAQVAASKEVSEAKIAASEDKFNYKEAVLNEKAEITEKYLEYIEDLSKEKLFIVGSIYDEKDKAFNQAIIILKETVKYGEEALNDVQECQQRIKRIENVRRIIQKDNETIKDDITRIECKISIFTETHLQEETKYDHLIDMKDDLNIIDYKIKLRQQAIKLLKSAGEINEQEINLIRKKSEQEITDEKLMLINEQLDSMKSKEFNALSSMKASFYSQKSINDLFINRIKLGNPALNTITPTYLDHPMIEGEGVVINNKKNIEEKSRETINNISRNS